jgi:hypothetical protein
LVSTLYCSCLCCRHTERERKKKKENKIRNTSPQPGFAWRLLAKRTPPTCPFHFYMNFCLYIILLLLLCHDNNELLLYYIMIKYSLYAFHLFFIIHVILFYFLVSLSLVINNILYNLIHGIILNPFYQFVFAYLTVQSLAFKLTVLRSKFLFLSIEFSLATVILYAKNCTSFIFKLYFF